MRASPELISKSLVDARYTEHDTNMTVFDSVYSNKNLPPFISSSTGDTFPETKIVALTAAFSESGC